MVDKYKKIFVITILINVIFFAYYLVNSDINPSVDTFYYLALADSFHNGTCLANISTTPPQPIYTPQNGIVFIHILLHSMGLHGAENRLLAIKLINYFGFILIIYIFYRIFKQLTVSSELTYLALGILLCSAHFFKTINQPLNEGIWCVLTASVFYLAISNENRESSFKIAIIALCGIILANFRLNGPIIILSIAFAYLFLRKFSKSLIFIIIFMLSYLSIYIVLAMLDVDCSGFKREFSPVYTINFIFSRPLITLIYTLPGAFLGITSSKWFSLSDKPLGELLTLSGMWIILLPVSIMLCYYYVIYFLKEIKEKHFIKLTAISYIILLLLCLQLMPGGDSRYIIMVVPFMLLTIVTYFNDSKKLRVLLGILLLCTISISMFRLIWWDSIYFNNNKSYSNIRTSVNEPYMLISESPLYSYYIFRKSSNSVKDINKGLKNIVVFGRDNFDRDIIERLQEQVKINHIEYLPDKITTGHGLNETYTTIKIIAE